jgi:hypothetical protein
MVKYIRNTVALVGMGGSFALFGARPFMTPGLRAWVPVLVILIVVATWLLVLVVNKLFLGVFAPGPRMTPVQREAVREALRQGARKDQPMAFLQIICFAGVGVPMIFLMKEFGWSINSVLVVGIVLSIIMALVFSVVRRRQGQN